MWKIDFTPSSNNCILDFILIMSTEVKMEYATLNNGVKMPKVFFGTYLIPPEETEKAVLEAIK